MENKILLHLSVIPKSYGNKFRYYFRRGNRFFFVADDIDKRFSMLLSDKEAVNFNLEKNKTYFINNLDE
jgi:hypothetical protein